MNMSKVLACVLALAGAGSLPASSILAATTTGAAPAQSANPAPGANPAGVANPAPVFEKPVGDIIGQTVRYDHGGAKTLLDIAVENGLGFVEMVAANPGVDLWVPDPEKPLILPKAHILPDAPRQGIVINLADQRLYYFRPDGTVDTAPIGIGDMATSTPLGATKVVRKQEKPTWWPTDNIRARKPDLPRMVPPGPDNPLGRYALYLGWPAYLIHGTNVEYSVGRPLTNGCIRLYDADIERLFKTVPVGTPVRVVDQPVKVGWANGRLWLEVHPTQPQAAALEAGQSPPPAVHRDIAVKIVDAARRYGVPPDLMIDWRLVDRVAAEHRGIPVAISRTTS